MGSGRLFLPDLLTSSLSEMDCGGWTSAPGRRAELTGPCPVPSCDINAISAKIILALTHCSSCTIYCVAFHHAV